MYNIDDSTTIRSQARECVASIRVFQCVPTNKGKLFKKKHYA